MPITLIAALATLALTIIAMLVLAAKLATKLVDAEQARARLELKLAGSEALAKFYGAVNASLLAELTDFRAAKAKRLANLSRGTPKAKASGGVTV